MKNASILFLLLLLGPSFSFAQLSLEHVYEPTINNGGSLEATLVRVDDNEWRYVAKDMSVKQIMVYTLDHQLEKSIPFPDTEHINYKYVQVGLFSRSTFNIDNKYEFIIGYTVSDGTVITSILRIYNEDLAVLFSSDSVQFSSIANTPLGTKITMSSFTGKTFVYSIPGKYFPSSISEKGDKASSASAALPVSIYPNPANDHITINYTLPQGISTATLIITDMMGKEIVNYGVGSVFSDITISTAGLSNGQYYYRIHSTGGESALRSFSIQK